MQGKITKTAVDRLEPWSVLWDSEVKGFGVRRHGANARHYLLRYRFGGKQTFRKIGRHGSPFTPDTARKEARRLSGLLATCVNPGAQPPQSEEFASELERYLAHKQPRLKPQAYVTVTHHLRKHAKPLHTLPLAKIDRRTIAQVLAGVERNAGPIARNRARASLSAFFAWLIREGLIETNPVAGTGKANEGPSRDRVLTQTELAEVWHAATRTFGDIIHFHVFKEFNWYRGKLALDARLKGVAPWRLHDLRRSCATGMAELGVQPHIIEAVLNHVSGHKGGVAGIYNRAKYEPEMRTALQRWLTTLRR